MAILEFTDAELNQQIHGQIPMVSMADLFDVDYPTLYERVQKLSGSRIIRVGDTYWYQIQRGKNIADISRQTGVTPASIIRAIEKSGYDLDDVEESGNYGFTIAMPERVIQAWESLGDLAMTFFRMKLEETKDLVNRDIPVVRMRLPDEKTGHLQLPLLPQDFELIDLFVEHSVSGSGATRIPNRGRAKVIRRLLEDMVQTTPELEPFRRAELSYKPASNYMGASWATTFNAPVYLWLRAEEIKAPRRGASGPNLSSFMRDAIQAIIENPDLLVNSPRPVVYTQPPKFNSIFADHGEEWRFNLPILTITLLDNQKEQVKVLREKYGYQGRGGHSEFLAHVLLIALMKDQQFQQENLPGWNEYVKFIQQPSWGAKDRDTVRQYLKLFEKVFVMNTAEKDI